MHNPKFNEDLKQMSIYVYQDGNGKIPEGWKLIRTDSNNKTGYYAESYKKDKERTFHKLISRKTIVAPESIG